MRAARIYLTFMALISVAFGLMYLVAPLTMTTPMGFGELKPSALTDVRANYGGFQIGIGLFLFFCLRRERLRLGMLLAFLVAAAIAISRAIGFALDRDVVPPLQGALIFEIVLALISLVIYLRMPISAQHSSPPRQ
jgi:hypothetical protein